MRSHNHIYVLAVLLLSVPVSASLPRMAVLSIDMDDFAPDSAVLHVVSQRLEESGRFQMVDLGEAAYLPITGSFLDSLRTIAAEYSVDVFMALELLHPEVNDRTVMRQDSLVTVRVVSVEALGRFYSSTGSLIENLRGTATREGRLPLEPDTHRLAMQAAEGLAERSLLEVFPMEVTFEAGDREVFTIPMGTANGIDRGTVMAVVAVSSGIPDDPSEYRWLRSRGLLQVMDTGRTSSTARLLSGRLVEGGTVTAVEQSAPAVIFLEYSGAMQSVERGTGLGPDEDLWANRLRLGVETAKWGFSFGGGIVAGGLEHSSLVGVDLMAGARLPLRSPSLGLRITGGGEMAFHMQDVRSLEIVSNATAISVAALADVTLEYLFSDHLGLQLGVTGLYGSSAQSWTVQEYTGNVRDAEPDEIYYTSLEQGPVSAHVGVMYF
ncbi:MAG: hypothetical protein R6U39_03825, partial [Candidatus Aegiribacteria sp.]